MDLIGLHHERRFQGRLRWLALGSALATLAVWGAATSAAPERAPLPGPLAAHHAPLRESCDACHAAAPDAVKSPAHGFVATALDLEQSERCLRCHALGEQPLAAHGWDRDELAVRSRRASRVPEPFTGTPGGPQGELACSACHVEHRGARSSLTELGDERCQVCHAQPFEGLARHPGFDAYPHARRTRLIFDHRTHLDRHFRERAEEAPTRCTDCHRLDPAGERMPLVEYARSCAACHEDQILGSGQLGGVGTAVLALPALDTWSLEGAELEVWPADSSISDQGLTPFLELLLDADPSLADDLAAWRRVDPLDLEDATAQERSSVERVAGAVRDLFGAIATGGHGALLERLPEPARAATRHAGDLLAGLPESLVREAIVRWLPELAGGPTSASEADFDPDRDRAREAWASAGGWYRSELDFSLRYRPAGHADPFLRAWLELGAALGGSGFERLADEQAVGVCTKCHSVDREGERRRVNWTDAARDARDLTRFRHRPHLLSREDNACLECHRLRPRSEAYLEAFEGPDPSRFTSNFAELGVDACARCHEPGGAPAGCVDCHEYHAFRGLEAPARLPGPGADR